MNNNNFEHRAFRLGDCIVDPVMLSISRGSDVAQVQPKVMQVLLCLVANHGQVVTKEYLLEHVWSGVFVVDGALRRCIFLLRKHLQPETDGVKYLETIPRRGYRLIQVPQSLEVASSEEQNVTTQPTAIDQAYRGLRVFEQTHSQIFFGREEAVAQVTQALDEQVSEGRAFVVVLGASGCGKSSLVRAGVLPTLVNRAKANSKELVSIVFQLSESAVHPLEYLAQKLVEAATTSNLAGAAEKNLTAIFEKDFDTGITTVLEHLSNEDSRQIRWLIVFDQFEELFTHYKMRDVEREQMVSALYSLARSGYVWVIATMRSEFYPQFMTHQNLLLLKGRHGQVDLAFPDAANISDIVRRPAQVAGFTFETDKFNRRLDQTLIQDATEHPNSLPLLQFALRELEMSAGKKKILKLGHYKNLGSLNGCLSMHAERVFNSLPKDVQAVLPDVLDLMVIADPRNAGRVLKCTVKLSEFRNNSKDRMLIDAFIEARLIVSFLDKSTQVPSIQITHEAVLAHWQRAREWAQENYAEMKFRHWLAELSSGWHADKKAGHYLLRDGKPLLEAKRLADKPNALNTEVINFVQASSKSARRSGLIKRAVGTSMVILTIAALVLWQNALSSAKKTRAASLRAEAITDFMVSNFESADPGNTGGRILNAKEMLEHARSSVTKMADEKPEIRAAILRVIGESYIKMGQQNDAKAVLSLAESILPEIEVDNPRLAAQVLVELGGISRELQQYEQAAVYFQRAHAHAARTEDYFLKASVYNVTGLLAHNQQKHKDALGNYTLAIHALDRMKDESRNIILLRADLYNNQAMSLFLSQKTDESGLQFEQAIEYIKQHGLENTPEYSTVLGNLGTLRRVQNRNEEAVDLYDAAIQLRTQMHGQNHPKIVSFLVNKVSAELTLTRYNDAVRSAKKGLDIIASGGSYDLMAAPLLYTKYLTALWRAGHVITPQDIAAAKSAIPKLVDAYGEDHPVVLESQAAIAAGLEFVAQAE